MEVEREEFSVEQMMGYLFEQNRFTRGRCHVDGNLPEINQPARTDHCFSGVAGTDAAEGDFPEAGKTLRGNHARANPNYELSKSFSPA